MEEVVFRYRARQLDSQDIRFIRALISKHYQRGRSHISRQLMRDLAMGSAQREAQRIRGAGPAVAPGRARSH